MTRADRPVRAAGCHCASGRASSSGTGAQGGNIAITQDFPGPGARLGRARSRTRARLSRFTRWPPRARARAPPRARAPAPPRAPGTRRGRGRCSCRSRSPGARGPARAVARIRRGRNKEETGRRDAAGTRDAVDGRLLVEGDLLRGVERVPVLRRRELGHLLGRVTCERRRGSAKFRRRQPARARQERRVPGAAP